MNSRVVVLLASTALLGAACDRIKSVLPSSTISGEYRKEVHHADSTGRVDSELIYDFRSNGTFRTKHSMSLLGVPTSSTSEGTYTIKGSNLEITRTSFTVNGETTQDVSHYTFSLEQNGDLITQDGVRLKKQ